MTNTLYAAHTALRTTLAAVPQDAWTLPTPCENWNVTQVLQHATGDQQAYASVITGEPGPDFNPFDPSGTLSENPQEFAERAMTASARAWDSIGDDVQDAPTPLPQGKMPKWLGAGAAALDAGVHAWDIAVATGQPSPLTPELSKELLVVAKEIVEPLRQYGAYAAALDPQEGDDDTAALLRYLGRNPAWTA